MKPLCLWTILLAFLAFCFLGCGEDENSFESDIFHYQPVDPYAKMAIAPKLLIIPIRRRVITQFSWLHYARDHITFVRFA